MPFDVDELIVARQRVAEHKAELNIRRDYHTSCKLAVEMALIAQHGADLGLRMLAYAVDQDKQTQEAQDDLRKVERAYLLAEATLEGLLDRRRQLEFDQRERLAEQERNRDGLHTPI